MSEDIAYQVLADGKALLHPTLGIMRGLYCTDSAKKPLGMTVGEVRKIASFVSRATTLAAQAIEARRAETGTGSVEDESAVAAGDAPNPRSREEGN